MAAHPVYFMHKQSEAAAKQPWPCCLPAWERQIASATAEAAELCETAVIPVGEKCMACSPAIISCCCRPLPCPPLLQSHEHHSVFFLLILFVQVKSLDLGLAVRRYL